MTHASETRSDAPTRTERVDETTAAKRQRSRLSTTALVTLVGALLAASISGTNLVFELWPGLKPDPKQKVGGKVANLALDINVPFGAFLVRSGQQPPADANLKEVGNVFYVRADTEGFKRETVRLKWFTYRAGNDERLPGLRASAKAERLFKPQAPIDTQIAQVWVPTPLDRRKLFRPLRALQRRRPPRIRRLEDVRDPRRVTRLRRAPAIVHVLNLV
jgi:hypothetical protein